MIEREREGIPLPNTSETYVISFVLLLLLHDPSEDDETNSSETPAYDEFS